MSSVGQAVGGIVGGTIGFFTGGPAWALRGAQIGMIVGGAIDPPKGPVINGPRLDDLSAQTASYGTFIPRAYGTVPVTGNVFWVQGDKLIEVITSTTSGGKGGPEQTTNLASYYASFAVGLCQGPIDGVRRIWIGGQLWYDAGSDDLATIIASNEAASSFTLYLGTDTQAADPLIQADRGVANVPAYRGRAYIVFDMLPLEKYGNSLMAAQVKVEVVKNATLSADLVDTLVIPANASWSLYRSCACNQHDPYGYRNFVIANSGTPASTYWIREIGGAINVTKLSDDGYVNAISTSLTELQYAYAGDAFSNTNQYARWGSNGDLYWYDCGASYRCYALAEGGGNVFIAMTPVSGVGYYMVQVPKTYSGTSGSAGIEVPAYSVIYLNTQVNFSCLATWNGDAVVFSRQGGGTLNPLYIDIYTGSSTVPLALSDSFSVLVGGDANPIISQTASGYVSDDKLYIVHSAAVSSATILVVDLIKKAIDVSYTVPASLSGITTPEWPSVYAHNNLVFWGQRQVSDAFRSQVWRLNKLTDSASLLLGDVVQAECLKSNLLSAGDIDVTELTDSVRGYRVSQLGAIRGALDPLRAAWPFDVVQHGYQIKFKRRGSASVATIPSSQLDARAAGEAPGVQITDSREMDLMLPRRVDVSYLDATREYDINKQMSPERTSTESISIRSVDLPIVFNAAESAQTAEMLLYLYWMERHDVSLRLPPEYSALEPGDVISITADTADYELRLLATNTLPDGRIECRAKYNKAAIYTPVAPGEEGQSTGGTLTLDGPAVYQLLDIPLLRDDDDTAGFTVAMAGSLSGWPGGVLYRSDDGGQTWSDLRAFTPGAVIGYANGTLSAHGGTVIDFSSTLSVRLYSGSLSSVTHTQMFAGQNWFAYGTHGRWEIIAAANCVLQGDGSYVLSDFLRGQRGTEWASGLHAAYDRLVMLDSAVLAFISVNSSTIGAARTYRGITSGKPLSSDADMSFTYAGVNLECLSPVHLTGNRHPGTNDWTLEWIRRSRYDQWRDYVDTPLGEVIESYEIDIYADGTYSTLKRTLTASTPAVAYTSAQQVTDFGSNQATLYVKIYQLSATVGRGYPLTTSITR